MKLADVEAILRSLNDANVRYLIVGGLAVVAHGYVRATVDLDIVLQLKGANALKAMQALKEIGYEPLIPVDAADFADEKKRQVWRDEKHMIVFQMRHPRPESTRLDIFVEEPFSFDEEYERAFWDTVANVRAPFLRYDELIRLKRASGRPQDLADIAELELIEKNRKA
jgi:hypothetical protein